MAECRWTRHMLGHFRMRNWLSCVCIAFIFKGCRWRQCFLSKCQWTPDLQHSVTCQKTWINHSWNLRFVNVNCDIWCRWCTMCWPLVVVCHSSGVKMWWDPKFYPEGSVAQSSTRMKTESWLSKHVSVSSVLKFYWQRAVLVIIWGLFDRASSSWNKVKCQLDANR